MFCLVKKVRLIVLTTAMTLPVLSMEESDPSLEFQAALAHYGRSLPVIEVDSRDPVQSISNYLLKLRGSKCPYINFEGLTEKVAQQCQSGKPIKMVLLGFPFKSTNRDLKCISHEVDVAEYLGLMTLQHLADQVCQVYKAGVQITIVSDGYGYTTAIDESDENIHRYQAGLVRLLSHFQVISYIGWKICDQILSIEDLRAQVSKVTVVESKETAETVNDMKMFVKKEFECESWNNRFKAQAIELTRAECAEIDKITVHPETSKPVNLKFLQAKKDNCINTAVNQLRREKTQETTLHLSQCSTQFSLFVSEKLPNYSSYIRLSVHPHEDVGKKLGIQLVCGQSGTPWHNAVVLDNGKFRFLDTKSNGKSPKIEPAQIRSVNLCGLELKYLIKK